MLLQYGCKGSDLFGSVQEDKKVSVSVLSMRRSIASWQVAILMLKE